MMLTASGQRVLRIGAAGVGYGSFIEPAVWLANHLAGIPRPPQIWTDHHFTARNFREGMRQLQDGEADLSLVNTRGLCAMAMRGNGMFDQPFVSLRGLVTFPHHDWCVFAVDRRFGVGSFAELKAKQPPLKIATGYLDGDNAIGWLCHELLRCHGIDPTDIERWGGEYLPFGVSRSRHLVMDGSANAIYEEATFGERFKQIFHKRELVCLGIEPGVVAALQAEYGWPCLTVPANFYHGQPAPLVCADASGWLLCARDDLDDDIATAIARLAVDNGAELGGSQLHLNDQVMLAGPLPPVLPHEVADTSPVPLHDAAARLYRERGLV